MTRLSGWGRFPHIDAEVALPATTSALAELVARGSPSIARGLGRSYGDSSLAQRVICTRGLDHFISFDDDSGVLRCQAGVSVADILQTFLPRGWLLPVTPGTRYVTLGGAIASDVHGKNHHRVGSFSDHVDSIEIMLGTGEIVTASRSSYPELFHATCGGMGLTGIVTSCTLRLQRVRSSYVRQTTYRADNLDAALERFAATADCTYSVAWIDCLARGRKLGRSLIMVGEHLNDGALEPLRGRAIPAGLELAGSAMNPLTMRIFNTLYFLRGAASNSTNSLRLDKYFYPLDSLSSWNRLYGPRGFLQYQFVLPAAAGTKGIKAILARVAAAGTGSFLAVLKVFGQNNPNMLSFPIAGYTVALDFQMESGVLGLLDELDAIVIDHGGRIYLAKDARMSASTFRACYPRWDEFQSVRSRFNALGRFASLQSARLGLE